MRRSYHQSTKDSYQILFWMMKTFALYSQPQACSPPSIRKRGRKKKEKKKKKYKTKHKTPATLCARNVTNSKQFSSAALHLALNNKSQERRKRKISGLHNSCCFFFPPPQRQHCWGGKKQTSRNIQCFTAKKQLITIHILPVMSSDF